MFHDPNPGREENFIQFINIDSLQKRKGFCEPSLKNQTEQDVFQFERLGYYAVNTVENREVRAFHRVVNLKDTWGKLG